jgi:hypothetical protein
MINKIDIIDQAIANLNFHIAHAENVRDNPSLYVTPENKQAIDIDEYLLDLNSKKYALEQERLLLD